MARTFADSDFVVLFTGEGAWSTLCHGWKSAKEYALSEFLTDDDDPKTREYYLSNFEDDDWWKYAESGKGVDDRLISEGHEIGEITRLTFVRIID